MILHVVNLVLDDVDLVQDPEELDGLAALRQPRDALAEGIDVDLTYIYIYIYRERERYIYIYDILYTYTYIIIPSRTILYDR